MYHNNLSAKACPPSHRYWHCTCTHLPFKLIKNKRTNEEVEWVDITQSGWSRILKVSILLFFPCRPDLFRTIAQFTRANFVSLIGISMNRQYIYCDIYPFMELISLIWIHVLVLSYFSTVVVLFRHSSSPCYLLGGVNPYCSPHLHKVCPFGIGLTHKPQHNFFSVVMETIFKSPLKIQWHYVEKTQKTLYSNDRRMLLYCVHLASRRLFAFTTI